MSKKTVLIVSAGAEAVHAVRRAQDMGLQVLVSDRDSSAPGFSVAGDGLLASTYDPSGTADAAEDYVRKKGPIHGVLTVAADVPLTVATVAQRLGLPGISIESASLAQDKLAMKERFAAAGIPVPWFAPVPSPDALKWLVDERGFDLVIKPVDSRGSRGVQRLSPKTDLSAAWGIAAAHSLSGRVMAEAYLTGPQISTESILLDGQGFTPGFSDRNYELLDRYAPFFVENGGDLPSHLPRIFQFAVMRTAEAAGRAMGIQTGNVKGDMVLHDGKPYVIELAARASGGYFCTHEIPLNTGVDFVGCVIKLALGETVTPDELKPRFQRPIVQRYLFPEPGRVISVSGEDDARTAPGVEELIVSAKPGDVLRTPQHAGCTAAMVLTSGATVAEARARAASALAKLSVRTVPEQEAA
jgi:biotin carboxylase